MHTLSRLALCVLLWLPVAGYAQATDDQPPPPEAQTAPPPGTEPSAPPLIPAPPPPPSQGEIIPRQMEAQEEGSNLIVPRILVGSTLGTLAGAGGAIVGLIAGLSIGDCSIFSGCENEFLAATPVVLGLWTASSLTVYGMGRVLDGRAEMFPTMLGGALGTTIGLMAGIPANAVYIVPLTAAVGAIIGFELSHASVKPAPEKDPFATAGFQWTPVISMTPSGGAYGGLSGRF